MNGMNKKSPESNAVQRREQVRALILAQADRMHRKYLADMRARKIERIEQALGSRRMLELLDGCVNETNKD